MNRADPFFERDATGWQFINMGNGNVDMQFTLYDNNDRSVGFNKTNKRPEDKAYQDENSRIPPQNHY
jgi:hypothetical protein